MKAGYVYDPIYLKHDTGQHPENAKRLEAIIAHLEKTGLKDELSHISPRPATVEEVAMVHQAEHIIRVQETARKGGGWLDLDTVTSKESYDVALYAAGGAIKAVEAVMDGEVNSAFALVRPPGHHATATQAMGFCLFNNVAIATRCALAQYALKKVAIIDFDVHHGNGTQEAFYRESRVLYISTHEYPLYPGTGTVEETGSGEARGTSINVPMPSKCGDREYLQVFEQIIEPAVKRFAPQLIMVSAGYDPHWSDGLATMQVSVSGFAKMVQIIKKLADELCNGRLVLSLEGGYNLTSLSASVKATFNVLLGKKEIEDPVGRAPDRWLAPDIRDLIKQIREIHSLT